MPGFDGTGPMGQGPMTGGGRGYCAVPLTDIRQQFVGRGFYGRGGGRGFRNCFWATGRPGWMRSQGGMYSFGSFGRMANKEDEVIFLKNQAELLKQQLEDTESRLREAESRMEPRQQ